VFVFLLCARLIRFKKTGDSQRRFGKLGQADQGNASQQLTKAYCFVAAMRVTLSTASIVVNNFSNLFLCKKE
jgi:hypothetical protein